MQQNQIQLDYNHHNDEDQLLTESDMKFGNTQRLVGFVQEYQVKIITKLSTPASKLFFWTLNIETYISIILLVFLYLKYKSNYYSTFPYFSLLVLTVCLIELTLKINISCNIRKETQNYVVKNAFYQKLNVFNKKAQNKLLDKLSCIWGILQVDTFYVLSLIEQLQQYNNRIIDFDERTNKTRENEVSHSSIQLLFSYAKFRQIYINLKLCIFLLILSNPDNEDTKGITLLIIFYIAYFFVMNLWINFHLACVYLFCRQCCLSKTDLLLLLGEIMVKASHSMFFIYILTHIGEVQPYFSSIFMIICTMFGISISVQVNRQFDTPGYGIFEMIFFGFSNNYYVGLKHREYFVKRVAYQYKVEVLKQILIFVVQITITLHFYQTKISFAYIEKESIIGIISILGITRVSIILLKIRYYLKPKQRLIRVKIFSGVTHLIEENPNDSNVNLQNLNKMFHETHDSLNEKPLSLTNTEQINQNIMLNSQKPSSPTLKNNVSLLKARDMKEILQSKMDQSQFKMTFYSCSTIGEYEINQELIQILSQLVSYTKSELIYLISNQIKIMNQYGHINVFIHKYDKNIIKFIEKYIIPYSSSIQIDSNYSKNTDIQIQILLLYNTINSELDLNTKLSLKPQDLIMKLPITAQRKKVFHNIVHQICNAKLISILKIIALNRHLSPYLLSNSCYVLYDLVEYDN